MASANLETIRTKIRRLTRSPSQAQITNAEIDNYVNTFILYDFPEHLRLFDLHTSYSFYTNPFVDQYSLEDLGALNLYSTFNPPIYVAGYEVQFSQSEEQFYGLWPFLASIQSIGTAGDGVTTSYTGTLSTRPILRNKVLFDSVDVDGNALTLIDQPVDPLTGNLVPPDNPLAVAGFIDYVSGDYAFTFPAAPAANAPINSQTVPYNPSRPLSVLFYDNIFTLRPVPDQAYKVTIEAFKRPTELISVGDEPLLQQWWQYIAYGAAKKIFEDRMDMDSVAQIMPEYEKQEKLVLRKTIVQQTNERVATIYTSQVDGPIWGSGWQGPW